MATYNVHAGHNNKAPGAGGCFSEVVEDRKVKDLIISKLRSLGHTVYDCTDDSGATANQNLANIVANCNKHKVDLDISIHFNAFNGSANGTEVFQYSTRTNATASAIQSAICALGFANRGVKISTGLYVLKRTVSPAILIECCFCDSAKDASIYNADKMATAIVKGITGKSVGGGTAAPSAPAASGEQMYRIRKTWADAKSQVGAYKNLDGAKSACPAGYTVFDKNGKAVYSNTPAAQPSTQQLYRIRKTWADAKSQVGAYKNLDGAKSACPSGYTVFDWNGKAVYTNNPTNIKPAVPQQPPKVEEPSVKPADPVKPEDTTLKVISPLKGVSREVFIAYVGQIAKEEMRRTGILASVSIAQAILESSWGQSELSLKANNLFGMKSSLSGNTWGSEWEGDIYTKSSAEFINGASTQIVSDFRLYKSPLDSIKDHTNYLAGAKNGNSLRYEGLAGETDYKIAFQIIKDGGYATDPEYVSKLSALVETYDLDVFDMEEDPADPDYDTESLETIKTDLSEMKGILKVILDVIQKIAGFFNK